MCATNPPTQQVHPPDPCTPHHCIAFGMERPLHAHKPPEEIQDGWEPG